MACRSYRWYRMLVVAAFCVVAAGVLTASGPLAVGPATHRPLRVLQMNLCDSGIARCYTGRSVTEAAAVIRAEAPDVVTLNEVCQDDVSVLDQALRAVFPVGAVVSAFQAAFDLQTAVAYRCRNGQAYGIGLVAHLPTPYPRYATYSGIYPTQDPRDTEKRVWLCLHAVGGLDACTTHLASTSAVVALAQCDYLLNTAIPAVHARDGGYQPTVLGADFNLGRGGTPGIQSCVPSAYAREGDGGGQYVVATIDFAVSSHRSISLDGATDHPGLLVGLTTPQITAGFR